MREGSKVGVCGPLPAFIQGLGGLVDLKTPPKQYFLFTIMGQSLVNTESLWKYYSLGEKKKKTQRISKPHKICI